MPSLLYFQRSEFECECCGEEHMADEFLAKLDNARQIAGVPFRVTSGWRCKKHNKDVGGKTGSEHTLGRSADIAADTSVLRYKIVMAAVYTGFRRIGIGEDFIHLGDSELHPKDVLWLY